MADSDALPCTDLNAAQKDVCELRCKHDDVTLSACRCLAWLIATVVAGRITDSAKVRDASVTV